MSLKKILLVVLALLLLISLLAPIMTAVYAADLDQESYYAQAKAGADTADLDDYRQQSLSTKEEKPEVPANALFVIDLSSWQNPGAIDYDLLASQVDGVILRIGFTGYGTGNSYYIDSAFEKHYEEFKKRNVPVGGYWYSCADTVAEGIAEANETLAYIRGKDFDLPVYWDTEDSYYQIKTSPKVLTDTALAYLQTIEDAGYVAGLYASANWYNNRLDLSRLQGYEIWVAHWGVDTPGLQSDYWMWQFTDQGRLDGYSGNLDFNFRAKNGPDIIKKVDPNAPKGSFSDVASDHWAFDYIENLYREGIVRGYGSSGEFRPDNKLTREHAAKMIAIAAGLDYSGKTAAFSDVDPDSEFTGYIAALAEKGAISGFSSDGSFRPGLNIKRSHMAKILVLAFDLEAGTGEVSFPDLPLNDPELCEYIMILASLGIVSGYSNTGLFKPDSEISRAEFSKMLYLAMEYKKLAE